MFLRHGLFTSLAAPVSSSSIPSAAVAAAAAVRAFEASRCKIKWSMGHLEEAARSEASKRRGGARVAPFLYGKKVRNFFSLAGSLLLLESRA